MEENKSFTIRIKPYSLAYRFLFVAAISLISFLLISILMIFAPTAQAMVLRVLLPLVLFLLGALWVFARFPWFLGFLLPTALFILFAFLRLDGVYSLELLIGYVPLAFAGSLVMRVVVQYMQDSKKLIYEDK